MKNTANISSNTNKRFVKSKGPTVNNDPSKAELGEILKGALLRIYPAEEAEALMSIYYKGYPAGEAA